MPRLRVDVGIDPYKCTVAKLREDMESVPRSVAQSKIQRRKHVNSYTMSDITVGLTESFETEITSEMMDMFYAITADNSPIHMDAQYAKQRGYEGRVVYGMLPASLFSTLAGVYLPGEHCLLHSVECKFVKPVFIGDKLTVTGTVSEINDTFNEITIKAVITNADGKKVTRGVIKAGVAK